MEKRKTKGEKQKSKSTSPHRCVPNNWLRCKEDKALIQLDSINPLFWKPLIDDSHDKKILREMLILKNQGREITFTKVANILIKKGVRICKETVHKKLLKWEGLGLLTNEKRDGITYWEFLGGFSEST